MRDITADQAEAHKAKMAAQKLKHIDPKDLKEPDAFFAFVGRLRRYVAEHPKTVALGAGALALGLISIIVGVSWRQQRLERNAETFLRAVDALEVGGLTTAKVVLENVAAGDRGIYGRLARLYEADIAAREGRWADAVTLYDAASKNAPTEYIRQIALVGKAFALEQAGTPAQAIDAYETAARLEGPYRESALRSAYRIANDLGDSERAAAIARDLLELVPDAPDADELAAATKQVRS